MKVKSKAVSQGGPPTSTSAQSLFSALPPDKNYEDKFVLGLYLDPHMVGCADIIRGYPQPDTAMIGCPLLSEKHQHQGLGKSSLALTEKLCLSWPEIHKARIGVVTDNAIVLPFWKKMGFMDTGIRRPYEHGSVRCEVVVLEKVLRS